MARHSFPPLAEGAEGEVTSPSEGVSGLFLVVDRRRRRHGFHAVLYGRGGDFLVAFVSQFQIAVAAPPSLSRATIHLHTSQPVNPSSTSVRFNDRYDTSLICSVDSCLLLEQLGGFNWHFLLFLEFISLVREDRGFTSDASNWSK